MEGRYGGDQVEGRYVGDQVEGRYGGDQVEGRYVGDQVEGRYMEGIRWWGGMEGTRRGGMEGTRRGGMEGRYGGDQVVGRYGGTNFSSITSLFHLPSLHLFSCITRLFTVTQSTPRKRGKRAYPSFLYRPAYSPTTVIITPSIEGIEPCPSPFVLSHVYFSKH